MNYCQAINQYTQGRENRKTPIANNEVSQSTLEKAFKKAYPVTVSRTELEATYLAAHHGHPRHARRAMERDLAKGRLPRAIKELLLNPA